MKKVLLFSGGLDSFMHYFLLKPDLLLYIDSGVSYSEIEIEHIYSQAELLRGTVVIIDNGLNLAVHEKESIIVPFRNMYYILKALHYGQNVIICANDSDSQTPDKSTAFLKKVNEFTKLLVRQDYWKDYCPDSWDSGEFLIEAPYAKLTKSEVMKLCIKAGVGRDSLCSIRSCYSTTSKKGCGECAPCAEKAVALMNNGIYRKGLFDVNPRDMVLKQYENHKKYRPETKTCEEFRLIARNLVNLF